MAGSSGRRSTGVQRAGRAAPAAAPAANDDDSNGDGSDDGSSSSEGGDTEPTVNPAIIIQATVIHILAAFDPQQQIPSELLNKNRLQPQR